MSADGLEGVRRAFIRTLNESMGMLKQFILLALVTLILVALVWIPVYVALGGGF